jgi:hypothetical protein
MFLLHKGEKNGLLYQHMTFANQFQLFDDFVFQRQLSHPAMPNPNLRLRGQAASPCPWILFWQLSPTQLAIR